MHCLLGQSELQCETLSDKTEGEGREGKEKELVVDQEEEPTTKENKTSPGRVAQAYNPRNQ